jgi:two-component system response regulator MprA
MGERVLVVDDDAPVRRMLERSLTAEGFEVEAAADGGAALVAAERSAPDLVVLDVAMPGLDGLAVCRRLRAKGLAGSILMLTARDAVADRVIGLEAGAGTSGTGSCSPTSRSTSVLGWRNAAGGPST